MATLYVNNLAKSYKTRDIIKDVSLEVNTGQVVGLLGPNGCGKTTCFYMIVGIIPADKGEIYIDDVELTNLSIDGRAKKGVGYLPQEASIFRKLSVEDNIYAVLETRKTLDKKQRKAALEDLLEEFHITHIRKSLGMSLSGGERRRVEIARALAANPEFVLLDEPFAGVDPISINDIKHIITHLRDRGIGVLITDHNVRETLDICEKAYIAGEGYIIASGDPNTVLDNQKVRDIYLGDEFSL